MGSPRVIGPGGVVHASGPPRLETGKTKKKLRLALSSVWFGIVFGRVWFCWLFLVKYHGPSRRLRCYASVAHYRQRFSTFRRCRCHWFSFPAARIHKSHRVIPAFSTLRLRLLPRVRHPSCPPGVLSPPRPPRPHVLRVATRSPS